jgi:AraC-like DNA-binding protein
MYKIRFLNFQSLGIVAQNMKLQFESVQPNPNSSFKLFAPRLNDFFLWHFHPEYEIVYIEAAQGKRHIGEHIAPFFENDLVLIGPFVPHLNFDYGIRTPYEKTVLQLKEDFLGKDFLQSVEMRDIQRLFENARQGCLCFHGEVKEKVGKRLQNLSNLPVFEQLLELLAIFQILALSTDYTQVLAKPVEQHSKIKEQERLRAVYLFIEKNYQRKIEIEEIATVSHLSKAAFCRYFKKMTRLTFIDFLNQYRVNQAKTLLQGDCTVTEACYACGFESLSYFNRVFKRVTGRNPKEDIRA